jgi:hypothetical protein
MCGAKLLGNYMNWPNSWLSYPRSTDFVVEYNFNLAFTIFPCPLFMIQALWHGILIAKKAYLQEASNGCCIDDHHQLSSLPWSRRDACVNIMKREKEFRGSGHTHVILSICSPNYGDVGMPRIIIPSQQ